MNVVDISGARSEVRVYTCYAPPAYSEDGEEKG